MEYFIGRYIVWSSQMMSLLIMGSSRADHQYVSSIFADSLNMTTYNAGSEGMCIYYHYAILNSYIERGSIPKMIILDVQELDANVSNGATFTLEAALDRLAPHYGTYNEIDEMFNMLGWKERIKLLSKTYRYNSKLVQSIKCNYIPEPEDRGYESVKGKLPDDVVFEEKPSANGVIEENKINYLKKFITLCKNNDIDLLMVYSPIFKNSTSSSIDLLKNIASENGIEFWDYSNEPSLIKRENFRDISHLHDEGAHKWSIFLAQKVKKNIYE